MKDITHIAILGGGPSGLFMFKRFVDAGNTDIHIDIFERTDRLGAGMPYSVNGSGDEHVTNVSGNEIPELVTPVDEWIETVQRDTLNKYHINRSKFNDYKVMPRLLFGQYLSAQFSLLQKEAKQAGISFNIRYNTEVADITDYPDQNFVVVTTATGETFEYDKVIICTGHNWPNKHERAIPGYFDSPYPPSKISFKAGHPVAIRGSSLTAIDALRTLSRHNGTYHKDDNGRLHYRLLQGSENFRLVMHSRNGLLPAVRFHLEDSHLSKTNTLTDEQIKQHRDQNNGFLSLDFVFEKDFKDPIREKRPAFYDKIKDLTMEEFVTAMMDQRESADPFELLAKEYAEAEVSIENHRSVYWKEALAILSFAMNYPAKHFSAEDMLRLQRVLMPLITVVIAFVPQSSVEELMALHQAGVLTMVTVGTESDVEPVKEGGIIYHYKDDEGNQHHEHYHTFVDCIGQPHLPYSDFPYQGLVKHQTISKATLKFKDASAGLKELGSGNNDVEADDQGNYYLNVAGIAINDDFQPVDGYGALNPRVYVMAVPYMGGYNPDYSGLDFCEAASEKIINSILKDGRTVAS